MLCMLSVCCSCVWCVMRACGVCACVWCVCLFCVCSLCVRACICEHASVRLRVTACVGARMHTLFIPLLNFYTYPVIDRGHVTTPMQCYGLRKIKSLKRENKLCQCVQNLMLIKKDKNTLRSKRFVKPVDAFLYLKIQGVYKNNNHIFVSVTRKFLSKQNFYKYKSFKESLPLTLILFRIY